MFVYCESCDGHHRDRSCLSVKIEPRKAYVIGDSESSYRVAVFSRAAIEAELGASVEGEDPARLVAELVGWAASYRGPGRGFSHEPSLRILKRNVVIRQFGGLDI